LALLYYIGISLSLENYINIAGTINNILVSLTDNYAIMADISPDDNNLI